MGEFSLMHLLVIAVLALVFFGPSRLPQFGQSLGKAIRGFKQGLSEIDAEVKPVNDSRDQLTAQQQSDAQKQTQSEKEKQNALNEVRILASIRDNNIIGYKEAFLDNSSCSLWYYM